MANPIGIGVLTGLLFGVSAIFFSSGHPVVGSVAAAVAIVMAFWSGIKFFSGKD